MINLKSVPVKIWLALAVIIFLLILIFGKCNTDKPVEKIITHVTDPIIIKERNAYRDTVEYYRNEIAKSKAELQGSTKLLKRANTELNSLIVRYNKATLEQNTPERLVTCDSLVVENTQLFEQIGQYQIDMNELSEYYELALKASDSAALKSNYLLTAANAKNIQLTSSYNDLANVYNKQLRKSKRNRGLNRVLAAAVLGIGIIAVAK